MSLMLRMLASTRSGGLTDPSFSSVPLLLHMNGTNGGIIFTDSSGFARTPASTNGTTTSTTAPKFGTASAYFNGAMSLNYNTDSGLIFGTSDYTVEFFVKTSIASGVIAGTGFGAGEWSIYINGSIDLQLYAANSFVAGFNGNIATSAWRHVAIVRSGTAVSIYVDGVKGTGGGGVDSVDYTSASQLLLGSVGGFGFTGYIDEFRVTKGVARYSANFTPPSAAFPDA